PRAARLSEVRAEVDRLERRRLELATEREAAHLAAVRLVETLTVEVARAREAHAVARTEAQRLRGHALDIREARLDGMAAEIAGALAVGASCPVCGSCDHPHKAAVRAGAPDDAAEKAAVRAADDAAATEHLRDMEVRDLAARLTAATERVEEVPSALAAEESAIDAALTRLTAEQEGLAAELADFDEALASSYARREQSGRAALAALDAVETAATALAEAQDALTLAVAEAGFATAEEALAAHLQPRDYDRLAAAVADHDRRLAAVTAVLAEPGAAEVAAAELPDLPALEQAHRSALDALGAARAQEAAWTGRASRLAGLVADLDAALREWEPMREELELATALCSFVEGKSADNRLQMRLSAYVLAYRLSQVVAAANARLGRMSDQRYSLEHTGRRGAGETRGGLSLLVRDDWSGESRDPATLSGGETFVVSLALALGLADVVTQEAGGADLDTLFVDEGFGSLDADTLDDVMDTLDSLRDGGRVVGVVSHVAEMRDRIPTRLVVTKSRRGSTLAVSR
uniref:SbcC/MukB-like Walker B domain-containing protein n=1 Tax=Nocardioides sp. TaxID=35761 RepID=UPI0025F67DB1